MPVDALLSFNAATGKFDTANATNVITSTGVTTPNATAGTAIAPSIVQIPGVAKSTALYCRIRYNTAQTTGGTGAVAFAVQGYFQNPINGSPAGWYNVSDAPTEGANLTTTAGSGERYLPVTTDARQLRVVLTFTGTGTGATINFVADLVNSKV